MKYYIFSESSVGVSYDDTIPDGAVECDQSVYENPKGYSVVDGKLIAPTDEQIKDFQHAEDVQSAESQKQALLDLATQKIAPLQDAVDLDIATDDEKAQLTAWKKYRVLVNRVDTSTAPNITWPTSPDDESTTSSSTATTTGDATTS